MREDLTEPRTELVIPVFQDTTVPSTSGRWILPLIEAMKSLEAIKAHRQRQKDNYELNKDRMNANARLRRHRARKKLLEKIK